MIVSHKNHLNLFLSRKPLNVITVKVSTIEHSIIKFISYGIQENFQKFVSFQQLGLYEDRVMSTLLYRVSVLFTYTTDLDNF